MDEGSRIMLPLRQIGMDNQIGLRNLHLIVSFEVGASGDNPAINIEKPPRYPLHSLRKSNADH